MRQQATLSNSGTVFLTEAKPSESGRSLIELCDRIYVNCQLKKARERVKELEAVRV